MRRKASLSVSSFFEKQKRASESVMWRWPKEKKADAGMAVTPARSQSWRQTAKSRRSRSGRSSGASQSGNSVGMPILVVSASRK